MSRSRGARRWTPIFVLGALGLLTRCTEAGDAAPSRPDAAIREEADARPPEDGGAPDCPDAARQTELRCTGLYADPAKKVVAPDVFAFEPAFPLWSDGAKKSRWVYLPPGSKIDTSDMNEWRFPIGTKLWKEFVFGGRRVETRMLEKQADGKWLRQAFKWSDDETAATELKNGELDVRGTGYEIPPQEACAVCHDGRIDGVLGFEAVSLSGEKATGLTMKELVARGLVTHAPSTSLAVPGTPTEQAALTWLHANCGTSCHSASPYARANFTYLFLRLEADKLSSVASTDTVRETVRVVSGFQPNEGEVLFRVDPGKPSRSVVFLRASVRDAAQKMQMPPIATHVVDDAGVEALRSWISSLPP